MTQPPPRTRWLALLVGIVACAPGAKEPGREVLTVFAAASLSGAFAELGRTFEQQHGYAVRYNFAGSQQLLLQLRHGATADVFASADERWMQVAADSGLLSGPATVFARNKLTVILPRPNRAGIDDLADLARPGLKLVLGSEAVPVGKYAREVLRNLSDPHGLGAAYENGVLRNVVSLEDNVRAVATKVRLGEADAGIVYRSDVTPDLANDVTVLPIPDRFNLVTTYPIAVLRSSREQAAARAFLALVLSAEGQSLLERHGLMRISADRASGAVER